MFLPLQSVLVVLMLELLSVVSRYQQLLSFWNMRISKIHQRISSVNNKHIGCVFKNSNVFKIFQNSSKRIPSVV